MDNTEKYSRIPNRIWETINYVLQYASNSEDWLAVKKEIMWQLPNRYRKYFGRRHHTTRKHSINDFDQLVIDYWYEETGKRLTIADKQRHDPEWVNHGRGHATQLILKQKKLLKNKESNEQ